jgi:pyruvate/2-oxoglutarate dehydrogenase complex dihydrolipoamide dehydrogenase (E3) component
LIAIGAGAGGLVSSKQSARRGAKSALISEHLAGGDCLNVGCVPSKALLIAAKMVRHVRRATSEFGVVVGNNNNNNRNPTTTATTGDDPSSNAAAGGTTTVTVDFAKIMRRLREKRLAIAPADGHDGTVATGAHVYQGRGVFTSPTTIRVMVSGGDGDGTTTTTTDLHFRQAVIATGGRPAIPTDITGLPDAPYSTNEILFNLEQLPPRMVILGAGVIALEMAQAFASFGSLVTVVMRSAPLLASKQADEEAGQLLQQELEQCGVTFVVARTKTVQTLRDRDPHDTSVLPLMVVTVELLDDNNDNGDHLVDYECECLLVAMGRMPNVENLGLEAAGVDYQVGQGIIVNDRAQSVSNANVYSVGDCTAGTPRLTHVAGEMAKLAVQNSLFGDDWHVSSLVIPAVMYTEPEYATVGISSGSMAAQHDMLVDVYRAGLEHNDRAIIEGNNVGFCKIFCKRGTDEIVGATIVAERAGEMINEVSLAIQHKIGLRAIGRNIHAYPTTGEAVMACGIQYINAHWQRLD